MVRKEFLPSFSATVFQLAPFPAVTFYRHLFSRDIVFFYSHLITKPEREDMKPRKFKVNTKHPTGNRYKHRNLHTFLRWQVNYFPIKWSSASTGSISSEVIHPHYLSYRPFTYCKVRWKDWSPKENEKMFLLNYSSRDGLKWQLAPYYDPANSAP